MLVRVAKRVLSVETEARTVFCRPVIDNLGRRPKIPPPFLKERRGVKKKRV